MRIFEVALLTVTVFASFLTPNASLAEITTCEARCVAIQTGVQTQLEIGMKWRKYQSDRILLRDFGMVNGSSLSQLEAACQSLSADYMQTFANWTLIGDQVEVKLAEDISVDLSDRLKVITDWLEKKTCETNK